MLIVNQNLGLKGKFPCCQSLKGPINPKMLLDNSKNHAKRVFNNSTLLLKFYHFHVSKIFTSVSGLFFPHNEGV